ncbi:hypothetical protein Taro_041932 [Colocasia esculenta]|uniref:Uncharacterized protein n=1 Tax=Colocasia esculenta TaxID=4460 RepID=A0A843WV21_COLES|nr:hypothetical protein [Colocasia esculenta]
MPPLSLSLGNFTAQRGLCNLGRLDLAAIAGSLPSLPACASTERPLAGPSPLPPTARVLSVSSGYRVLLYGADLSTPPGGSGRGGMGILFTRMLSSVFGNREARILVLGLDNAGKTTILCTPICTPRSFSRFRLGLIAFLPFQIGFRWGKWSRRSQVPIGFNVETVQYNNIKFQVWDLGMTTPIRKQLAQRCSVT